MRQNPRAATRFDVAVARLQLLQGSDPGAATTLAIELIDRERAHRVLEPALDWLIDHPVAAARPTLRSRFVDLTDNGVRYDQDCELRVRLVRAFRAIGAREDQDLAELGLRTIQLQPPGRVDVAQPLRGQCVLWLSELDPIRADYFAVELLHDPHRSVFNGEPTVTAIQVLAAHGQPLPIWAVAQEASAPDVLAQAFASLRQAPADLQLGILRKHLATARAAGENGEGVALVAAEAIVLNRLAGGYSDVIDLLRDTPNQNLFLYLAMTIGRSADPALRPLLLSLRKHLADDRKRRVLDDAVALRPHQ